MRSGMTLEEDAYWEAQGEIWDHLGVPGLIGREIDVFVGKPRFWRYKSRHCMLCGVRLRGDRILAKITTLGSRWRAICFDRTACRKRYPGTINDQWRARERKKHERMGAELVGAGYSPPEKKE